MSSSTMLTTSKKKKKSSFSLFRPHLSLKEQSVFIKRFSLLVKAGVPLYEAMRMLEEQTTSGANKKMFSQIKHDIASGQFLYKSLSRFPKVFGQFTINIVRVGEASGTLYINLKYLSDEIEKKRILRQKVVGALVYPLVIVVAALGISSLMIVFLFPKLLPIFQSLNVPLPFTTRALLYLSFVLTHYWLYIILSIVLVVVVLVVLTRTVKPFRFAMHHLSLRLPILGPMLKHYYLANICRISGTLFRSDFRVIETVSVTAETTTNLVYRDRLEKLGESLTKGGKISSYFQKHPRLFPSMLSNMVAVGETTGSLSDTLIYLGDIYEGELDEQTKRLSSIIEPVLMVGVGLMVGFIAVSIITPIYEVTQHLNPR